MKILYAFAVQKNIPGIINQALSEKETAVNLKGSWDVYVFSPKGRGSLKRSEVEPAKWVESLWGRSLFFRIIQSIIFKYKFYRWLQNKQAKYDALVLRYQSCDPFQLLLVLKSKKPVYFVHHTFEEDELSLRGDSLVNVRKSIEIFLGRRAIKKARGVVGVTNEIANYEKKRASVPDKPSFVYPNGVSKSSVPVKDLRGNIPELLFVASTFSCWRGLDLLIESVEASSDQFVLHLVGEVLELEEERARNDVRIIVHGVKTESEIREIAQSCWLGLASFALYRKGMKEGCNLKVRDYLGMGLPVYGGYREVFPDSFPFFVQGPPSITNILAFAHKNRAIDRAVIAERSVENFSKEMIQRNLYKNICDDLRMR
ncbi:glycosyl transferase family 4 [Halospina denitrificans]|uniref:Glycosyl transferase family 4 n=1 Tax=Halospina denitrificans TaxID=332522 RepID=A0A4R7JZA4_9GAMM|nr:glycosyltransferase [Halospina denitrificans]TDT43446.1 glycosyl transferase family 4 [Halospina denitrificans]